MSKKDTVAAARHLVEDPVFEDRRLRFTIEDIRYALAEVMVGRGFDRDDVDSAAWVWAAIDGAPVLYVVMPGGAVA